MAPAGCCPLHSTPGTQNLQNRQVARPISGSEPAEPELMLSSPARLQWTAAISYCLLALAMCHLDKEEEGWGACPAPGATPCPWFYLYSIFNNTQEIYRCTFTFRSLMSSPEEKIPWRNRRKNPWEDPHSKENVSGWDYKSLQNTGVEE